MGISDTAAIVTCSVCNLLEFLCFVVIIFEMSRHHKTHVRLCLSNKVDLFNSAIGQLILLCQKNELTLPSKLIGYSGYWLMLAWQQKKTWVC